MAYIEPNTMITFFKNTGLSTSYENTLYFSSESDKNLYFANWSSVSGRQIGTSGNTYQRSNRGYCRVEIPISKLYDCDYMRFTNPDFENKLYYAFITAVNYVNNITTEVEYELDYLMTWMGTFTLGQCYVERQHVRNDSIGANICDEGISTGPYVEEGYEVSTNYGATNSLIRIQYTNPDEVHSAVIGGVFTPLITVDKETASEAADFIQDLTSQDLIDNVVNVYMIPKPFKYATDSSSEDTNVSISKPYETVAGYVPKNKKLFCYPYKYMEVDNSEGSTKMYKYEYFNTLPDSTSTGECGFRVLGNTINNVELALVPKYYNGHGWINYTDSLAMTQFPTCAWSNDIYQAYLAQKNAFYTRDIAQTVVQTALGNAGGIASDALGNYNQDVQSRTHSERRGYKSSVQGTLPTSTASLGATIGTAIAPGVGTAVGAGVGALVGYGASVAGSALGRVASNMVDNTIQPEAGSRMSGNPTSNILYGLNKKQYTFHKMSITKNYAMMIDNYFTMFGYKIRQILVPNMNARPHWTYVKTVDCLVNGRMPAVDRGIIEQVFNNGVRFWKSLDEMGNYSLDNSPS